MSLLFPIKSRNPATGLVMLLSKTDTLSSAEPSAALVLTRLAIVTLMALLRVPMMLQRQGTRTSKGKFPIVMVPASTLLPN